MINHSVLMNIGMKCLSENSGLVEAEHFIAFLLSGRKKIYFKIWPLEETGNKAMKYYQENTFEEGFCLGAQIILEAINRDIPISGNISVFVYMKKTRGRRRY